jgi:uncharacterized protein (TIGR00255 family)
MTGFATAARENAEARVHVSVKSVNHRFLDIAVKAPASLAALDGRLRALAQPRLARGRLDVTIGIEHLGASRRQVRLDEALLAEVARALGSAAEKGLVTGALTPGDVLRLPQALDIRSPDTEPGGLASDAATALVEETAAAALDALAAMRATEGAMLASDFAGRLARLAAQVDEIERLAREGQSALEGRLRERVEALPPDLRADPAALAQEIVRFAARSDVDEELVRMRGHLEHWRVLVEGDEPCGRKLDFLVQEMNRELNTLGSKVEGVRTTEVVIAAKAELERIREQVQNVE